MCMRNSEEGCILSEQQTALKKEVAALDIRMTKLEGAFSTMRSETQEGFKQGAVAMQEINKGVANLAHNFAQRFNNLETTVVAEKVKWGETLRWIVKVSVKVLLAGVLVAMGINAIDSFFKGLSHGDVPCEKTER